jgi:hypothetical protein
MYDIQNDTNKVPYILSETIFEITITNETISWIVDGVTVRSLPNPDTLKVYKFQIYGLECVNGTSTYDNIAVYPLLVGTPGPTGPTGPTGPEFWPLVTVQGDAVVTSPTSAQLQVPLTELQPIIQSVGSYYAGTDVVRARWQVSSFTAVSNYVWIGLTNGLTLLPGEGGWWFFALSRGGYDGNYQYVAENSGISIYNIGTTVFEISITNETISWIVDGVTVQSIPNPDTLKV